MSMSMPMPMSMSMSMYMYMYMYMYMIRCAASHSASQHVSPCPQHVMLLIAQGLQVALACGTSLVEKRSECSV